MFFGPLGKLATFFGSLNVSRNGELCVESHPQATCDVDGTLEVLRLLFKQSLICGWTVRLGCGTFGPVGKKKNGLETLRINQNSDIPT